jgi:hypothetical protein
LAQGGEWSEHPQAKTRFPAVEGAPERLALPLDGSRIAAADDFCAETLGDSKRGQAVVT